MSQESRDPLLKTLLLHLLASYELKRPGIFSVEVFHVFQQTAAAVHLTDGGREGAGKQGFLDNVATAAVSSRLLAERCFLLVLCK